jgi:hypothetical protein
LKETKLSDELKKYKKKKKDGSQVLVRYSIRVRVYVPVHIISNDGKHWGKYIKSNFLLKNISTQQLGFSISDTYGKLNDTQQNMLLYFKTIKPFKSFSYLIHIKF